MVKENRFLKNHPPVEFDPTEILRSGRIPEKPVVEETKEDERKTEMPTAAVAETTVPVEPVTMKNEESLVEEEIIPSPSTSKAAPKKKAKSLKDDLLGGMVSNKPAGKTSAFYLDDEVIDALDKLVEQYKKKDKKANKSKIVNTILRGVLFDD